MNTQSSTPRSIFGSLNRWLFAGLTFFGFVLLISSATVDWFSVPIASADAVSNSITRNDSSFAGMVDSVPCCTVWFKASMVVVAICLAASWLWKRRWTMASTIVAGVACLIPLAYPYAVMVRSPQISADATWLHMQHNNLTWLGGDIYANAEFGARAWNSKSYLIDPPRNMAAGNLPVWTPEEFGLHHCEDLLLWLGYTNAFCQFFRRGWVLAVLGTFVLLLTTFQKSKNDQGDLFQRPGSAGSISFARATIALAVMCAVAILAALAAWSLPFRACDELRNSELLCQRQQYAEAKTRLIRAAELYPVLSQDTVYVVQRGILDQRLNIDSGYAKLQTAHSLENIGRYDQAFAILRSLVSPVGSTESRDASTAANGTNSVIRREALRGVLRFAIQDYNCARFELSSDRFAFVLRHHPCDVKLIYLMQLQGIRESRPDEVNWLRDRMYVATKRFNFGTRKIIRAVSQQHAATASGLGNDPVAIWAAQSKAKNP